MMRILPLLFALPLLALNLEPQDWMRQQVASHLHNYQLGIRKTDVRSSYKKICNTLNGLREPIAYISIREGKCSWEVPADMPDVFLPRLKSFCELMQRLHTIEAIPSVEFLLSLDDCSERPLILHLTKVPIFSVSKSVRNHKVILVPQGIFDPQRQENSQALLQHSKESDWAQRNKKILWRFKTFIQRDIAFDWRTGPSIELLYLGLERDDILDFGIPQSFARSTVRVPSKRKHGKPDLTREDFVSNRYHLIFDQRAVPQDLEEHMSSGATLLLADAPYRVWFSTRLHANEHYIPLDERCNNLIDQFNWCEEHPEQAAQIGQNAQNFAKEHFCDEMLYGYLSEVLHQYAALFSAGSA